MIILDYFHNNHKQIIHACVSALKAGKAVAYPTDTSYGLAVDATSMAAIKKLYLIKGRDFNKPVHVIVPSISAAKKIVRWNTVASKLVKQFWPGPLTLVLPMTARRGVPLQKLSANTGFLGVRYPKNQIALDLSRVLKKPVTATSANVSGQKDCYAATDIIAQFKNQKYKPDIIINAGKLPKRMPSTLVKIENDQISILREGPISEKQIRSLLNTKQH